ncbi:unnamed protein product [Penicillium salamii]|nr:unnamed protein product [Penicillium salamii]CAG8311988.1 unnamed protein product [Penicillium salamii]
MLWLNLLLIFLRLVFALQKELPNSVVPKKVAVIAGSAGSSAAYYLNSYAARLGIPVNITVFERSPFIGGRSTIINVFDNPNLPVELGGTFLIQDNKNLMHAVEQFGLPLAHNALKKDLAVWDGSRFIVTKSGQASLWWDVVKMIWRYGLGSLFRTRNLREAAREKLLKLYDPPHFPFNNLSKATAEVGLTGLTNSTGAKLLSDHGVTDSFSQEIIQAITRMLYGQNLAIIHGLETLVCTLTDGVASVAGGNWKMFDRMLKASRANVRLNSSVTEIVRSPDGSFAISYSSENIQVSDRSFDDVVVTGPFQFSNITISPQPEKMPGVIHYVQLHITVLVSPHQLSPKFFNLPPQSTVPEIILTALPLDLNIGSRRDGVGPAGFWSLRRVRLETNGTLPEHLYKIISPEPLTAEFVSRLFGNEDSAGMSTLADIPKEHLSWYHEKAWQAYPYHYPTDKFEEIQLGDGLWYTSGIERFLSAMEMSSLSGMNVAALIATEWGKEVGQPATHLWHRIEQREL